jgi:hypothetical protein
MGYIESLKFEGVNSWQGGTWYEARAHEIKKILEDDRINADALIDYLRYSTLEQICQNGDGQLVCQANPHYDEPFMLWGLTVKQSDTKGPSNFKRMGQLIFRENYSRIDKVINDLMSTIQVRTIEP